MRAINPALKALIASGHAEVQHAGAAVLHKPFHLAQLYKAVRAAVVNGAASVSERAGTSSVH